MIKAIIFDFDGTLIELVDAHYSTLNEAIKEVAGPEFIISKNDQDNIFNGLSTETKLNILQQEYNLSYEHKATIRQLKQQKTREYINKNINRDDRLINILSKLKENGLKLYCASNAKVQTVNLGLEKLGIKYLFNGIFSNNDIRNQKPHSEIFLKCFIDAELNPNECLIIEDSKYGIEAAVNSGANVMTVNSPADLSYDYIIQQISKYKSSYKYKDTQLNIVIPMAGSGKRFVDAGYRLPKPLIDVNCAPMIKTVIDNINIDANYIFIIQKEHADKYQLDTILKLMVPTCNIIQVDKLTGGACETVLLAEKYINNDKNLLIANCDQYIEWDSADFLTASKSGLDGSILTFTANETKWSYAKTDENNFVVKVAEKKVISNDATVGVYFWSKGSEFVKYAHQMIEKNIKVNNEFYVCPVWNEAIQDGKKVKSIPCKKMHGLGTPEDLENFISMKDLSK